MMPDDPWVISPPDFAQWRSPWFDEQCQLRQNDPVLVGQELQIQYLASGNPRFDVALLEKAEQTLAAPKEQYRVIGGSSLTMIQVTAGDLCIFDEPVKGHKYCIGIDAASGVALQPSKSSVVTSKSAIVVVDSTAWPDELVVVATYSSRQLDPGWLAVLSARLGRKYNTALIVPEASGPGYALLSTLVGSGHAAPLYTNLYQQVVTKRSPTGKTPRRRVGFWTNAASRSLIEDAISRHLPNVKLRDRRILDELKTFVWVSTKTSAQGRAAAGCTDDLVIALGLALIGSDEYHGVPTEEEQAAVPFDALLDSYRTGQLDMQDVLELMRRSHTVT